MKDLCPIAKLKLEAKNELAEENCKIYKEELKSKLRALNRAEKVVANVQREVLDLEIRIKEELQ